MLEKINKIKERKEKAKDNMMKKRIKEEEWIIDTGGLHRVGIRGHFPQREN